MGNKFHPFLKEYSTISLLSLESALGAPGMKGALGMKADIYDYCLKETERNVNVKYEWLLVLQNVLLTWCQRRESQLSNLDDKDLGGARSGRDSYK